jgi:hypothetical protein
MKKLFVFMFLVFCNICFADENGKFIMEFDIGALGVGTSHIRNKFNFDLNANLFNLHIENSTTNVGIEFIPINYSYSISNNKHLLSFSTLYLYWNLYDFFRKNNSIDFDYKYIFGPFFSIRTFHINNFEYFSNDIIIYAGLKYTRSWIGAIGAKKMLVAFPNIEAGYKYFNDNHSIYVTISFSHTGIILTPILLLMAATGAF